ncbi:MAG: RHS repeat-associated core domain-containing protein, partial [Gammaproteobacteria bacterium]
AAGQVVTELGYDAQGNRTSHKEFSDSATAHTTTFTPDALNRIRQVRDAAGSDTLYGYNALDQLIAVTDPKGLTTGYLLNAFGDLKQQSSPDTGVTTYTFDAAGNRTSQVDARGVEVRYAYDALNRLTLIDYPGADQDVAYTYDSQAQPYGNGRLTGIADASGTMTLTYSARGNVTEERRTIAGTNYLTAYSYDPADRLTGIAYPSGRAVSYERNALGQVDAVKTSAGTTLAQDIAYLPFGPMSSYAMGNGIVSTRTYDQDYRLAEYQDGAIQHQRLYYDLRGNMDATENVLDASRSQSFGYDPLSRLTSAVGLYGIQGYTYDGVGNRLTQSTAEFTHVYTYADDSHRLLAISNGSGFSYDVAGNMIGRGDLTLTYNVAGRLQEVLRGSRRLGHYVYNASGQRAIKTAGEPGPDYLALAEEADRQAQAHHEEAARLMVLADQYEQQAPPLLAEAARVEQDADALLAHAEQASLEADGYLEQASPYLERAATWQQRADEDRAAAELETGKRREVLLRQAEREEAKAIDYLAKAQPFMDLHLQALERAAALDQQAQSLLADAQALRDEAQRLAELAQATRAEAQQRIEQAEAAEQQAAEYRRLAQEQEQNPPQVTTHFVYGRSGSILGEYRDDGSPVREYAWLDDMPLAQFDGAGDTPYAIHADHLNTPQKLTDESGQVVWDTSNEPFGTGTLLANAVEHPLRFPGQYFDAETGLHQNWFRDYDPSIGRYLQSDPIGLGGGLNTFTYALNNPLVFVDPFGLHVEACYYADAAAGFGHIGFGLPGEHGTRGFYPTGDPLDSPGEVRPDAQWESSCKTIPTNKYQESCMLKCRTERIANPGRYKLFSRQCTSFVRDCMAECSIPNGDYEGPKPKPFFDALPGKKK